jgi:hypothetical protein
MTAAARWKKVTVPPWKFEKVFSMHSFDIPDIKWIERFTVGISNPDRYLTQKEIDKQLDRVNKALRYGKLVAVEQNFTIMSSGNKDIIAQYTVYHVGFKHRPPGK